MADVHDKATRSYNMSQIKGKNTKPEVLVRKFLFSKGFRYRIHDKRLPGKPDIVLPKYKTVIFVNGCFWHGHNKCKYFILPKSNAQWWKEKLDRNIQNDILYQSKLLEQNWKVIVVWECDLKGSYSLQTLEKLMSDILS